jgi:hypothetical protein
VSLLLTATALRDHLPNRFGVEVHQSLLVDERKAGLSFEDH